MKIGKQEIIASNENGINAEERLRRIDIVGLMRNFKAVDFWEKEGVESVLKLIVSLKEKIGKYESVVSDDVSGRLVSLILWKIINKTRIVHNEKLAKILFVASGREIDGWQKVNQQKKFSINELIKNNKDKLGKTLVVTEYISSGESMERLIKIMSSYNIDFDIATVSIKCNPGAYSKIISDKVYYGEIGASGIMFYFKNIYAGVHKKFGSAEAFSEKLGPLTTEMKNVRGDINLLVDEAVKLIK